jgi:hypothetical protein
MLAAVIGAGLVKQTLSDIFPERVLSIKSNRVRLLDFDDPSAAGAFDAEHMVLDFCKAALLDRLRRCSEGWLSFPRLYDHASRLAFVMSAAKA